MWEREFSLFFAAMAQQVERRLGKAEVTGSNPVSSFFLKLNVPS